MVEKRTFEEEAEFGGFTADGAVGLRGDEGGCVVRQRMAV
jgi:hypothetical protein